MRRETGKDVLVDLPYYQVSPTPAFYADLKVLLGSLQPIPSSRRALPE
ncbi:hypothetical protein [Nonomuraea jabiensis]